MIDHRAGNADMHFLGAGIADHLDDLHEVVPRTIESSTRITRLPSIIARLAECFSLTPKARICCVGSKRSARHSDCG